MPYIPELKEAFALAPLCDREKVVDKLASVNTEDWFYYRGLILLQKLHDHIKESSELEKIREPTTAEAELMEEFTSLLGNFRTKFDENNEKYILLRARYHVLIFTIDSSKSTEFIKKDLYLDLDLTKKNTGIQEQDEANNNQGESSGPVKKSYPTALNPDLIDTKKLIQDAINKIDSNNSYLGLERLAYPVIGSMIADDNLVLTREQKITFLRDLMNYPSESLAEINLVDQIIEIFKSQNTFKNFNVDLNQIPFDNFTLDQMDKMMEAIPEKANDCQSFINAYLKKLVPAEYSQYLYSKISFWDDSNNVLGNYLDSLELFVTKLPDMYQSLKAAVQFHKLRRDIAREEIEEERFISYLNKTTKAVYEFSPKPARNSIFSGSNQEEKNITIDLPLFGPSTISRDEEWNLIKEYLTGLVVQNKLTLSLESLGKFIDYHNLLKPLYAEIMLTHSQDPETINKAIEILGNKKYEEIAKKSTLLFPPATLYKSSKRKPEDTIDIILRSKNIPRVSVRVYQIDSFNYWRLQLKTHGSIPSQPFKSKDMNLDGLCPTWENEIDIKFETALLETDTKLSFGEGAIAPQIFSGRGLWVLEFIGGSEQCRVVVQKGYMRHIMQNTTGGHIIQVIDEVGQPFYPGDVKVWHSNQFYKADKNGNILVPYLPSNESNTNCSMLLISEKDGFSEPFSFERLSESYRFTADFYVNTEMVSYNKTSKVLVNPRLELCGLPISLSLLENINLNVNCTNVRGVKSGTTMTNLTVNKNTPITAEFVAPEQLSYLEFELEATVKNLSDIEEKLNAKYSLSYDLDSNITAETATLHLKVTPDMKYLVYALGKNGEPKSGFEVSFDFKNIYRSTTISQVLQTNDEGIIELGELQDIQNISYTTPNIHGNWNVLKPLDETKALLPSTFCVQADKEFKITCPTQFSNSNYSIYSIGAGDSVLKNLNEKIKKENGYLIISGLPEGTYSIIIPATSGRVTSYLCTVIQKENNISKSDESKTLWSNWIIGKNQYSKESGNVLYRPIGIKEIQMTESNITFALKNWSSKTVAIITTSTFVPSQNYSLSSRLQDSRSLPNSSVSNYLVDQTRTVFLEGCKLGEEYQYILNRAKAEKWVGSTLTKPTLLMYPKKITETKSIQRNLKKSKTTTSAYQQLFGGASGSFNNFARYAKRSVNYIPSLSTLAFLKHASPLCFFYPDQEKGTISIDRSSLGDGNLLEIVILSGEQVISKEFVFPDLTSFDIKRNDIRSNVAYENKETVLIRSKAVSCLQPSDTMELKNTNGEWKAIDSFEKLYEYSQRISSSFGSDFNFLTRWPLLSTNEKLKLHEEKVCYEFNLWLKKKDVEFFNTFVAPAIQSKIQKSFMDLYLIDADLSEFEKSIYLFNKLSTPEKALLAVKQGGDFLAKVLRLFDDSFDKKVDSRSEIYFDSILTSCDVPLQDSTIVTEIIDKSIEKVMTRGERLENLVVGSSALRSAKFASAQPPPPPPAPASGALFAAPRSSNQSDMGFSLTSPQYSPNSPENVIIETQSSADYDKDEDEDDDDDDDEVMEEEEDLRAQANKRRKRVKYNFTEPTSEWTEISYYNGSSPAFISPSQFWVDFLQHHQTKPQQHFLSENFIYALSSMSEVLYVLSLIDLPFASKANWRKEATDSGLRISTDTPLMVFYRSLQEPSETSVASSGVILSQELFVYDPSVDVSSEDCVKVKPDSLETGVEYGRQLIISNISSKELVCEVTIQIPSGSVPTRQAPYFQSMPVTISPYSTLNDVTGTFYFPSPGGFILPSVSVATSTGILIAKSEVQELTVSNDKNQTLNTNEFADGNDSIAKISNWPSLASKGSNTSVIAFLEAYKKLDRVDLSLICWRMTDPSFARDVYNVLGKSRSYYTEVLWKYGVYHGFSDIVRELLFFNKLNYNTNYLGYSFDSVLISVEPSSFDSEQHVLDYYPLMNARSHPLNPKTHEILNNQFYKKYNEFLSYLEQKTTPLSTPDMVMLTLYLIIQERIGEAHDMFARIPKNENECTVQIDYLEAYLKTRIRADQCSLDSQLDLQGTKEKILKYKQFGVLKWRKLFASLLDYINEVEQGRGIISDNEIFNSDRLQTRAIHTEPTLDFEIDSDKAKIIVHYSNLESIDIRCYEMNVEVMFSENPFLNNSRTVSSKQENYSWIKPSYSQHVALSKEESHEAIDNEDEYDVIGAGAVTAIRTTTIDLPKELISSEGKNVFVELTSPDSPALKRRQAYFANRLSVQTVESFGIVRVLSEATKRPVPGVYVKVYARKKYTKEVEFWKDGYTGLNGVFDYISVTEGNALMGGSNANLKSMMENTIDKLSLLILSSEEGAVVKEVYPPVV